MKKILYGISGIGTGHTNRQLPLITHFARASKMVIFAYDESYRFYQALFRNTRNVTVIPIAIPFVAGGPEGLDFRATARVAVNNNKDFLRINCKALAQAADLLGKPDLVVTDYEPLSAQYAYAYNAPLVTIDQQSKYLCGSFPPVLRGQSCKDEIMRLHMFFPRANARIACSFFNVQKKQNGTNVLIFPPTLKDSIQSLKRKPTTHSLLFYISSQREFIQNARTILRIIAAQKNIHFHIFTRNASKFHKETLPPNVFVYEQGDPLFYSVLQKCAGIVSTAGHTLLSEAMYLGIPVYAIPLAVYEQQMNAHIIHKNHFGISHPTLDAKKLSFFVKNIPRFARAIEKDTRVLLRRPGQDDIITYLEQICTRA